MLADPKSAALEDDYAGQWLYQRALPQVSPDPAIYPSWDEPLRAAMGAETRRYFRAFLDGDVGFDQFLTADFSYVNDRLARHYGLPPVGSDQPQRVALPAGRRGLLGQASVLAVTSHPSRSSPVRRGRFVFEQLLCGEIPDPPPGVAGLIPEHIDAGTLRQQLDAHAANPACSSCHNAIDPLGYGLEHFDAIGAFRDSDGGNAIDASGKLADGTPFDGEPALAAALAAEPDFTRCAVRKLLIYALGRGLEADDDAAVAALTDAFAQGGHRLPDLIDRLARSDLFRRYQTRVDTAGGAP
jgi:hypothetical protein